MLGLRTISRLPRAALVVAFALAGCAKPTPAAAPLDGAAGARMLARCERTADRDVTSWSCDGLTAVDAIVLHATEKDVASAFEGFAATFGGEGARRVDSFFHKGNARHVTMRIEGQGPEGRGVEAQMVAVQVGEGVHLVTCSSKARPFSAREAPACAPVVEHLVGRALSASQDSAAGQTMGGGRPGVD